jgi:hypothetical protein
MAVLVVETPPRIRAHAHIMMLLNVPEGCCSCAVAASTRPRSRHRPGPSAAVWLRELDDVAIRIRIAGRPAPRFDPGRMKHGNPGEDEAFMHHLDIVYMQSDMCTRGVFRRATRKD